jgi:hypothetical protein
MSDRCRNAAEIAESLYAEFGQGAVSVVSARVEAARQACEVADVGLWNDVARMLLALDRRVRSEAAGCPGRSPDGQSIWAFMQRIEYYRHRAAEVERKAAAAPEAYRQDMLELAGQWRDLALHADLQAHSEGV